VQHLAFLSRAGLTLLRCEERKGKKQTENIIAAICFEPNPGATREFFLIKHYFLVSSESLRNEILFKLHELMFKTC